MQAVGEVARYLVTELGRRDGIQGAGEDLYRNRRAHRFAETLGQL